MAPVDVTESPRLYLSVFRSHVLEPFPTATTRVEQERNEIEREREAFQEFAERTRTLPTVSQTPSASCGTTVLGDGPSDRVERLQEAYEETVMDIPHYDAVYGESIGENLLAEFGPEFASLFDPSSGVGFTEYHRDALTSATRVRIEERERFEAVLDGERASLRTAKRTLESIIDDLDSTVVDDWYREEFFTRVDDLLSARQSDLGSRPTHSRLDGHDLCEYLYADEPWSYPVLTAGGRLLDSVVVRS